MADKEGKVSRRDFLKAATAVSAGVAALQLPAARAVLAQAEAVKLDFWDMVWGPTEYVDTAKKLVDQFNKSQSAIQVTYQSTPWNNWYQTFLTAIGSGTAPDISTGAGYQAVQFFDFGAILPIDDVLADMKADKSLDDFLPGVMDRLVYQEKHVALPWAIDIRIPYYRKDLLDKAGVKPPTNWTEFAAAAKALTSGDHYGVMYPAKDDLGWHVMVALMLNNGGGFFAEDGKLDVLNERNVEAFKFVADLVKSGSVHPGSVGFDPNTDAPKAFVQGSAAMYTTGPGFESRAEMTSVKDNIIVLPPIDSPHGTKGTIYWVNNVMIYTQSKDAKSTKTFLKWYSANQKVLWTEGHTGQMPTRASIAADPYFQNNANTKTILEKWVPAGQLFGTHVAGIFPALNALDGEGSLRTLAQDILQGKDVNESLKKLDAKFQTLVK